MSNNKCKNCNYIISGLYRARVGDGEALICPRCGYRNYMLPRLNVNGGKEMGSVKVGGGMVEGKTGLLTDLDVGNEFTFMNDTRVDFNVLEKGSNYIKIKSSKGKTYQVPLEKPWIDERILIVTGVVANKKKVAKKYVYSQGFIDSVKEGLTAMAPAIAISGVWDLMVTYETFKKVLNGLESQVAGAPSLIPGYANLKKQTYLGREALGPGGGSIVDLDPYFITDYEEMINFVKVVTPVVVDYAMRSGDEVALKGLGKLITGLREFRVENQISEKKEYKDYDRMIDQEITYKERPGMSQQDVSIS